ncbi:endo alpha-1,4 polygalactosaminidase [Litoribacillus peritrichatus]|uniref:Glycoside-hydrolase family GH114 TIM-barrel domain-containing protein n=1 Tax=Litoribacillus peritrichatus TaxID=718191 RepID=A0ABP7NA33_9GAMM
MKILMIPLNKWLLNRWMVLLMMFVFKAHAVETIMSPQDGEYANASRCAYNHAYQENWHNDSYQYIVDNAAGCYVLIDPFELEGSQAEMANQVSAIKAQWDIKGVRNEVGCYISVGTAENWREDFAQLQPFSVTKQWGEWAGEYFIKDLDGALPIMKQRIDRLAAFGCDWVEYDNMDWMEDEDYASTYGYIADPVQGYLYMEALCEHTRGQGMLCMSKNTRGVFGQHMDGVTFESYGNERDDDGVIGNHWWPKQDLIDFLNEEKLVLINHYHEDDCTGLYSKEVISQYGEKSDLISLICESEYLSSHQATSYRHYNEHGLGGVPPAPPQIVQAEAQLVGNALDNSDVQYDEVVVVSWDDKTERTSGVEDYTLSADIPAGVEQVWLRVCTDNPNRSHNQYTVNGVELSFPYSDSWQWLKVSASETLTVAFDTTNTYLDRIGYTDSLISETELNVLHSPTYCAWASKDENGGFDPVIEPVVVEAEDQNVGNGLDGNDEQDNEGVVVTWRNLDERRPRKNYHLIAQVPADMSTAWLRVCTDNPQYQNRFTINDVPHEFEYSALWQWIKVSDAVGDQLVVSLETTDTYLDRIAFDQGLASDNQILTYLNDVYPNDSNGCIWATR